jgi:predicted xylose isomerase-like sugar epimerase
MLPPPAAVLRKRRVPKVDDTAPVAMEQIGQALKRLGLGGLARRNDLASAFVVEATAAQIREPAATRGVQAIRLNRRHRNIRRS